MIPAGGTASPGSRLERTGAGVCEGTASAQSLICLTSSGGGIHTECQRGMTHEYALAEVYSCVLRSRGLDRCSVSLQTACVVPLCSRVGLLAPLRGYSRDTVASRFPCWSRKAWSHAVGVFGWTLLRPARGLGRPQQAASEYQKDIPMPCLHTLSEHISNLST